MSADSLAAEIKQRADEDIFVRLLKLIGEDPTRPGLVDTPARMAKAWAEWTQGYAGDPKAILRTFEDGAEQYDEMVHIAGIPFYSHCEHHLAPFYGSVDFAYIPNKRIVGLSKMSRLVDIFARRLQVQERLTTLVIDSFVDVIQPLGAGITIRARHHCMESRGINRPGCITTTNRFTGVLKSDPSARAEYLSLSK
jgi:GTP cyclohydrolase I